MHLELPPLNVVRSRVLRKILVANGDHIIGVFDCILVFGPDLTQQAKNVRHFLFTKAFLNFLGSLIMANSKKAKKVISMILFHY